MLKLKRKSSAGKGERGGGKASKKHAAASPSPLSKAEAQFDCIIQGGHLASAHSQADADAVYIVPCLLETRVRRVPWRGHRTRAGDCS